MEHVLQSLDLLGLLLDGSLQTFDLVVTVISGMSGMAGCICPVTVGVSGW